MNVTAESISEIKYPDEHFSIFKLNNLNFKFTPSEDFIHIPGKSFILPYDRHLWHFVQEYLVQYEIVNERVGDVKPVFFDRVFGGFNNSFEEFSQGIAKQTTYYKDIYRTYSDSNDVYDFEKNIVFEELYLILDLREWFPRDLFEAHGVLPYWFMNDDFMNLRHLTDSGKWQTQGFHLLNKRFSIYKQESEKKKIYISRRDANKRHFNSTESDRESWVRRRHFEHEDMFEKYFVDKGYTPVVLEGMNYRDQVNIMYNATHIVGTVGTGFMNIFSCNPRTRIIEIFVKPEYEFTYIYLSKKMDLDHYSIDLRYHDESVGGLKLINLDQIVPKLDEYSHLY
jgi:hypothetical protein